MLKNPNTDRRATLLADPINEDYLLGPDESDSLADLLYRGSVDAYCVTCKQPSVFRMKSGGGSPRDAAERQSKYGLIIAQAECQRERPNEGGLLCRGEIVVVFRRAAEKLTKIAQHPSKADLDFGPLDTAFRELPEDSRRELRRAIGLRSHDVGVGSFVYLRRIFERLLEDARKSESAKPGWDEETYTKSRVAERIAILRTELPRRLVDSAKLYGILSKGIHELSEEECLNSFNLVFQAIRLIVAEHHENKQFELVTKALNASSVSAAASTSFKTL